MSPVTPSRPAARAAALAADRERLLTPAAAAAAMGVDRHSLARWSRAGIGPRFIRTIGGHRRYLAVDVAVMSTPHPREEKP